MFPYHLIAPLVGSVVNLNHPGHYVHWGFIQISVANLVVIGLDGGRLRRGHPDPVPSARRGDR